MSAAATELRAAPASAESAQLPLRLTAFFCLAAFAAMRYATLIETPPAGRVVMLSACVTAGCGALAASGRLGHRAAGATLGRVALVLGTFAASLLLVRIPAHLLVPAEWPQLAAKLSGGADQLRGWLWPYRGGDRWAQAAVLLPLPGLLLAAGCALFWPSRAMLAARRALALAVLLAIFVTGTANAPGSVPAFDGSVLMGLVAAALLLPLPSGTQAGRAFWRLALCGGAALAAQSAIGSTSPWIHYRDTAGTGASTGTFQWDQLYGPDPWPRSKAPLLTVTGARPALLRVTSLDRFDGLRFLRSADPPGQARLDIPRSQGGRWRQRATIEIQGLRSPMLPSAGGVATGTRWLNQAAPDPAFQADGTATPAAATPRGAEYEVLSYRPRPSPAAARRAPRTYPRAYLPYVEFELPARGASALARPDLSAEARSSPPAARLIRPRAPGRTPASEPRTAARIEASPYAGVFALAQRLAAGSRSGYDIATRIQAYLRGRYGYDRGVALARYPLEAFLFSQGRGYCQQFSGAMALMLRMDGVPARVGVGFRPASSAARGATWAVRAADAHAWVEVFLSGIGWVEFDPTPPTAAGALHAGAGSLVLAANLGGHPKHAVSRAPASDAVAKAGPKAGARGAQPAPALLLALLGGLLALAALGAYGISARVRRGLEGDADGAAAELRLALRRVGRAEPGLTLARLERALQLEGRAEAAGYVSAIRERRFRGAAGAGPPPGRAALRRAIAPSSGLAGRARALRALPPAWAGFASRRRRQSRS